MIRHAGPPGASEMGWVYANEDGISQLAAQEHNVCLAMMG